MRVLLVNHELRFIGDGRSCKVLLQRIWRDISLLVHHSTAYLIVLAISGSIEVPMTNLYIDCISFIFLIQLGLVDLLLIHLALKLSTHAMSIDVLQVSSVFILYLICLILIVEDLLEVVLDVPHLCILYQVKISISIVFVEMLEDLWVEFVLILKLLLIYLHVRMDCREITQTYSLHGNFDRLLSNRLDEMTTLILTLIYVVFIIVLLLFDLILIHD